MERSTAAWSLAPSPESSATSPRRHVVRPTNNNLNARIRILVNEYFGRVTQTGKHKGKFRVSIARAAKVCGMSQRGMFKLYHGTVTDPRHSSVMAIVRGFGAVEDPTWIALGRHLNHLVSDPAPAPRAPTRQPDSPYADLPDQSARPRAARAGRPIGETIGLAD